MKKILSLSEIDWGGLIPLATLVGLIFISLL